MKIAQFSDHCFSISGYRQKKQDLKKRYLLHSSHWRAIILRIVGSTTPNQSKSKCKTAMKATYEKVHLLSVIQFIFNSQFIFISEFQPLPNEIIVIHTYILKLFINYCSFLRNAACIHSGSKMRYYSTSPKISMSKDMNIVDSMENRTFTNDSDDLLTFSQL